MSEDKEAEELYKRLETIAKNKNCYLNPDKDFVMGIARGLLANRKKYGYMSCPCRLASGEGKRDLDIMCPCVYMLPDVKEFGMCYCALYVSKDVIDGKIKVHSIPERRPREKFTD